MSDTQYKSSAGPGTVVQSVQSQTDEYRRGPQATGIGDNAPMYQRQVWHPYQRPQQQRYPQQTQNQSRLHPEQMPRELVRPAVLPAADEAGHERSSLRPHEVNKANIPNPPVRGNGMTRGFRGNRFQRGSHPGTQAGRGGNVMQAARNEEKAGDQGSTVTQSPATSNNPRGGFTSNSGRGRGGNLRYSDRGKDSISSNPNGRGRGTPLQLRGRGGARESNNRLDDRDYQRSARIDPEFSRDNLSERGDNDGPRRGVSGPPKQLYNADIGYRSSRPNSGQTAVSVKTPAVQAASEPAVAPREPAQALTVISVDAVTSHHSSELESPVPANRPLPGIINTGVDLRTVRGKRADLSRQSKRRDDFSRGNAVRQVTAGASGSFANAEAEEGDPTEPVLSQRPEHVDRDRPDIRNIARTDSARDHRPMHSQNLTALPTLVYRPGKHAEASAYGKPHHGFSHLHLLVDDAKDEAGSTTASPVSPDARYGSAGASLRNLEPLYGNASTIDLLSALSPGLEPKRGTYRASENASIASSTIGDTESVNSGTARRYKLDDSNLGESERAFGGDVIRDLKTAYRQINDAEERIKDEDSVRQADLQSLSPDNCAAISCEHTKLADMYYDFMLRALDSHVPPSINALPQKYDIPLRLWENAFKIPLEAMIRRAAMTAVEPDSVSTPYWDQAADFMYSSYIFYANCLQEEYFRGLRYIWLERLGDVANYRMQLSQIRLLDKPGPAQLRSLDSMPAQSGKKLFAEDKKQAPIYKRKIKTKPKLASTRPSNDDDLEEAESLGNSIGTAALTSWELHEEKTWCIVATDWYYQALIELPGSGQLHLKLADLQGEHHLRRLYHLVKASVSSHPDSQAVFALQRWLERERQRYNAETGPLTDLFIHAYGLLSGPASVFKKLEAEMYAKFEENFCKVKASQSSIHAGTTTIPSVVTVQHKLEYDATWTMFAILNIASLLQFSDEQNILRNAITTGRSKQSHTLAFKDTYNAWPNLTSSGFEALNMDEMSLQDEGRSDNASLTNALDFAFSMLTHCCKFTFKPCGTEQVINPYVTIFLTFLGSVCQIPAVKAILAPHIPWPAILGVVRLVPDSSMGVFDDASVKLFGTPLPEDWCIRGMEWTGRQLFGRGYWRSKFSTGAVFQNDDGINASLMPSNEAEALSETFEGSSMPPHEGGPIEANLNPSGDGRASHERETVAKLRWKRVALMTVWLSRIFPEVKIDKLSEARSQAATPDYLTRIRRRDADFPILNDTVASEEPTESAQSAGAGTTDCDKEETEISDLLKQARADALRSAYSSTNGTHHAKGAGYSVNLRAMPGWTTLVFDTNVLLTALSLFEKVMLSKQWISVVPLSVVTEINGLQQRQNALGLAAKNAMLALTSLMSDAGATLKIVTSRGNYLRDLTQRSEDIDFGPGVSRTIDDVIVRAGIWEKEHWMDRRGLLHPSAGVDRSQPIKSNVVKVLLVSNDRNLRLKGRAKGLDVAAPAELEILVNPG